MKFSPFRFLSSNLWILFAFFISTAADGADWNQSLAKMRSAAIEKEVELLAFLYSFEGDSAQDFVSWVPEERGSFIGVEPRQEDFQFDRFFSILNRGLTSSVRLCMIHSHPQKFPMIAKRDLSPNDLVRRKYQKLAQHGAPSAPPSIQDTFYTREFEEMVAIDYPKIKATEIGMVVDALGVWVYRELIEENKKFELKSQEAMFTKKQKAWAQQLRAERSPADAARMIWITEMSRPEAKAESVRNSEFYPVLRWAFTFEGTLLSFRSHSEASREPPCYTP